MEVLESHQAGLIEGEVEDVVEILESHQAGLIEGEGKM